MNTDTPLSAADAALWQLWQRLLDTLLQYFESTPPEQRRASMLDIARSFLRDNGVNAQGAGSGEVKQSLQQLRDMKLPFSK